MGWGMWFWLLIIAGFSYLFYINTISKRPITKNDDPFEIARFRLARGEITTEEFDRIKKMLEESI